MIVSLSSVCTATLYHQITVLCTVEAISAAVLEALMPVLNETRSGVEALGQRLNSVEDRLVDINKKILATQSVVERSLNESMTTVNDNIIQESLTDHLTQICAKMDVINSRINSVSSAINGTIDSKLDLLDSKQYELEMKVMSVNSELEQNILTNITKQLKKTSESSHEALGSCGGEGWRRVAYLDMTESNTTCPSGWRHNTGYPRRTCGKVSTGRLTCDSVFFPVSGGAYTSVCGRIKGYQNSRTDAFEVYHNGDATTIEEPYVSGVSLTHGSPRQHIWTFAASATSSQTNIEACPCNSTTHNSTPPFVGGDYFCESGVNSGSPRGFHPDDPLWDGDSCAVSSTCCPFNNPPYFTKQLPNTTTDDLEVRLCWWDREDETPIELIELYVGFGEVNTKEPHHNVLINTQQLTDMICSKMELINVSMREEFRAVERQFQKHKNQTTSELSDLYTSLQSTHTTQICDKMDRINSRIISISSVINGTIDSKLDLLDSKQDELDMKVMSVNSELEQNILTNITRQLKKTSESSQEALGLCGGEGWRRVAYLDMTESNTICPSGWRHNTGYPRRTCGKVSTGRLTCDSVFFPVSGGAYTSVCGRIKGYQNSRTDAFEVYHNGDATTIEEPYVSGVSLTHGSPRQHIWTFAASATSSQTNVEACPCNSTTHNSTPPFVGGDYFCESGVNSGLPYGFHPDDPLWDGDSCAVSSTCCPFNNPPYFTKQLPNTTTDDLEVRLCWWDREDETPIELIELYVNGFGEVNTKEPHHNVLINTQQLTDMICSKMERINVSMREEFRAVERQFQKHKNQTTSELSDLYTSLQSTHTDHLTQICDKMDGINSRIISVSSVINGTIDSKLDLLDSKQDELDMKVMSVNSKLEQNILTNITNQVKNSSQEALAPCGGTGGWRRVAYLDMTDPNTTCPSCWQLTGHSKRTCGKVSTGHFTCDSVFFPVCGGAYTSVCGRIKGYQYERTDAFESYHDGQATTIDEAYVSGVSLTHGSPRQHIWTFAAGYSEGDPTRADSCPCDATISISVPPFVGGDYFCESGTNSEHSFTFYPDDPLWDGASCTSSSTCCTFNNPPYFTKQLPNPTTDDLEVRLCRMDGGDDTPIEFMELYIK